MTTTPILNGRIIGQAERATRAVLDRLLVPHDIDFASWVTINLLAAGGGSSPETGLVRQLAAGMRMPESEARTAVAATVTAALTEQSGGPGTITLTGAGTGVHARIQADIDRLTEVLYGDLPPADLATAGRVLTLITERATAQLAPA